MESTSVAPSETPNARSRLLDAAVEQIARLGVARVSARSVAEAAGMVASSINYNFGTIERMYCAAFAQGSTLAEAWISLRKDELAQLPKSRQSASLALEYVVGAWTQGTRPLALLYQECASDRPGRGPAVLWTKLWRNFWIDAALQLGMGEDEGRLMHLFFESEALHHLCSWSPVLETAALREMCNHFCATWLGARPVPPTGALAQAQRLSGVRFAGSLGAAAMKIAEAAAAVVEQRGLDGLTHRAVAARAAVTTGAVAHHFRTVEDLVAGAIRGQVQVASKSDDTGENAAPAPPMTKAQLFAATRAAVMTEDLGGPALGRRHLFMAAIRRPGMANAAAVSRFSYGATTEGALVANFDIPEDLRALYAATFARLLSSIWIASTADPDPRAARERAYVEVVSRLLQSFGEDETARRSLVEQR